MFPGQGCQYIDMGKELLKKHQSYTDLASNILGYSIIDLCSGNFPFELDTMSETIYSQPAIFVVSCLNFIEYQSTLEVNDIDICIGHSLGLFSALFAANVFNFEQGLKIINKRASLMQKMSKGAMAAIIGDGIEKLQQLLISNDLFDIDIANHNGPKQVVVSGPEDSIVKCKEIIEKNDMRYIRLAVSGAFHSRLMDPARIDFANYLVNIQFNDPKIKVISTTNAQEINLEFIIEELSYQLVKPVRWHETILYLNKKFPNSTFLEFGPGSTLTGLNKYIL